MLEPNIADYAQRWEAKFNQPPKSVYAYLVRDAFEIWVQAVEKAGCVDCYDQIIENIRAIEFSGNGGLYKFNPTDQQALWGDDYLPTLWYQIENGANAIVGSDNFKQAEYILPPWIK